MGRTYKPKTKPFSNTAGTPVTEPIHPDDFPYFLMRAVGRVIEIVLQARLKTFGIPQLIMPCQPSPQIWEHTIDVLVAVPRR